MRRGLEKILKKGQILEQEPLSRHTTFGVGGPADFYLTPNAEQLPVLMNWLKDCGFPVTVIGNGSNLLVGDGGVRGAVIEIGRQMAEVSVKDGCCITAQAGALLSRAAHEAYRNALGGMEFAAGIPGSVGGAMVMNAGAYGGEMKDIVRSVRVLDQDGRVLTLSGEDMGFGYRSSCIEENRFLVLEADFRLEPSDPERIYARMEELKKKRMEKQPLEYQSAGSTFKRPEGYFAGKLIMDAGLAGYTVGGAQISEKHCGFVINRGGATAADVLSVICHAKQKVKETFGVDLETEVKMLGEFGFPVEYLKGQGEGL